MQSLEVIEAFPHHPGADTFNFGRSWLLVKHACRGHKLLIATTTIVTLALLTLYLMLWAPIYTAQVKLVAQSDKDATRAGFYQNWAVFREDNLSDEVQMFTAAPVLREVIERLGLTYDDVYHPFLSQAGHLWTESWPGRTYHRLKESLFPPKRGPYDPSPDDVKLGRVLDDFKAGVQLDPVVDTDVGKLIVKGPTPRVAEIANTIVAVYLEQRRKRQVQEAEDAYKALDVEAQNAQAELSTLEAKMEQYYSQNGLLLTFEKDKIDIGHWESLTAGVNDIKTTIAGLEQSLAEVNALLGKEQKDVVTAQTVMVNPVQDSMHEKLAQVELAKKQALIHFKPDSPEIGEYNQQIANLQDQLAHEPKSSVRQTTLALNSGYEQLRQRKLQIETELAGQRAQLAVRTEAADRYHTMIDLIPAKMKVVHEFDRQHAALEKKYGELHDKLMIAMISKTTAQSAAPSIHVVEDASAPAEASWPKTKLLLLVGALFGAIAGVLSALLVDLVHGRVNRHRLASGDWDFSVYAIVDRDHPFAAQLFPPPALEGGSDGGSGRAGVIVGHDRIVAAQMAPPPGHNQAEADGEQDASVRLIGFQY